MQPYVYYQCPWAGPYNTWRFIQLMPKDVAFSVLFLSTPTQTEGAVLAGVLSQHAQGVQLAVLPQ